jgi:inner membrane protein involved in colicin E2 resistance
MPSILRMVAIVVVFIVSSVAWLVLGGITDSRGREQTEKLRGSVQSLWGNRQTQAAPVLTFRWQTQRTELRTETKNGVEVKVEELVTTEHERTVPVVSTKIDVDLASDLRQKGLAWYSLYGVTFDADYGYLHKEETPGTLEVALTFPDAGAIYDEFELSIDGVDGSRGLDPNGGIVRAFADVKPGQKLAVHVHYKSRGLDAWQYMPGQGVGRLEAFDLRMRTNFPDIDFPAGTLSPSHKKRTDRGWDLSWQFAQVVTGQGIGMVTPHRIQPGELASELAVSAPISLFFFFFVIFVLATLRKIDIHPINYMLIAGAFFAFHLLFAYSVDHLPIEWAFALASGVSVFLVVSYLGLVVSPRFAYVEAALAQLVYLVGFALAHFWDGYTGLTTTVLAVLTLYMLMQLTGKVRWSEVLAPAKPGFPHTAEAQR